MTFFLSPPSLSAIFCQDLLSETGSQENGAGIEKVESSQCLVDEFDSTDRYFIRNIINILLW